MQSQGEHVKHQTRFNCSWLNQGPWSHETGTLPAAPPYRPAKISVTQLSKVMGTTICLSNEIRGLYFWDRPRQSLELDQNQGYSYLKASYHMTGYELKLLIISWGKNPQYFISQFRLIKNSQMSL